MARGTPSTVSLPSTLALRSLLSKSATFPSAFLDFIRPVVCRLGHPGGPSDGRSQEPFVHLLLVQARKPGAGGHVLDRAVAVKDPPPTIRQVHHLGHVTVLGGRLGELADARLKV